VTSSWSFIRQHIVVFSTDTRLLKRKESISVLIIHIKV